ncbi:MAG TPA: HupE/UreJ family protein [Burkholderiales bacterium]|nr:HupE/UreJ family protein [Burkholderiales bacterium]
MKQGIGGFLVLLGLLAAGIAYAHPGPHADFSVVRGLAHLLTEPDHLLALAVAGIAAVASLRARSRILRLGGAAVALAGISFVLLV